MSEIFNLLSFNTFSTGYIVFLNKSMFNSSNLALVRVSEKETPGTKSTSIFVVYDVDRIRFADSTSRFNLEYADLCSGVFAFFKSSPCLLFIYFNK